MEENRGYVVREIRVMALTGNTASLTLEDSVSSR